MADPVDLPRINSTLLGDLESKHGIIEHVYECVPGLTDVLRLQRQHAQDEGVIPVC